VQGALASQDPTALWKISDLTDEVDAEGKRQPLGKALLLGTWWHGEFEMGDARFMGRAQDYINRKKGDGK